MQDSAIILINKERGISSNKVVNKVKYLLNAKKAGHLGTLDVLGEGLLPITLNKATKLFELFLEKDKEYITTFKFGQTSLTLDLEGPLTTEDEKLNLEIDDVKKVIEKFVGKQMQMPPQYSAKKISGKKAYQLARDGKQADLKPKEITIYDLQLLEKVEKNTFKFKVYCSSGTYIRSFCRDIANELSTCGVMLNIIRTKCGIFNLKDAYTITDIENGNYSIVKPDILFDYPQTTISFKEFEKLSNGEQIDTKCNGKVKVYFENQFLGIAVCDNSKLKLQLRLF